MSSLKQFSPGELVRILEASTKVDGVFIVGGQAANIWANMFAKRNEALGKYGPFTSKDIDFFGTAEDAKRLAELIGATAETPSIDDNTPNSAKVTATIDGVELIIDFVDHVIGIQDNHLKGRIVTLRLPTADNTNFQELSIRLMHPIDCLASRVANHKQLGRRDATASRQLKAAPHILREYIRSMIDAGEIRKAQRIIKRLTKYIRSDKNGRFIHKLDCDDPIEILQELENDSRLDHRFRHYLGIWILEIQGHRRNLDARLNPATALSN
ncbi:MAG: hypothetical protein JJ878_07815 [Alphaproteobacteria bacterium]|nr:hypothetical protein [Alphaproteobacteria bacterium]